MIYVGVNVAWGGTGSTARNRLTNVAQVLVRMVPRASTWSATSNVAAHLSTPEVCVRPCTTRADPNTTHVKTGQLVWCLQTDSIGVFVQKVHYCTLLTLSPLAVNFEDR